MRRIVHSLALTSLVLITGCASNPSAATAAAAPAKAGRKTWVCPVCSQEFAGEGQVAYYGLYEVRCCSRADAEQLTALPASKRAQLATAQVLQQKKITNTTCPLTGETLTAAAAPATYETVVIGFASIADANQFKSLPKEKQKVIIDRWQNQSVASN